MSRWLQVIVGAAVIAGGIAAVIAVKKGQAENWFRTGGMIGEVSAEACLAGQQMALHRPDRIDAFKEETIEESRKSEMKPGGSKELDTMVEAAFIAAYDACVIRVIEEKVDHEKVNANR